MLQFSKITKSLFFQNYHCFSRWNHVQKSPSDPNFSSFESFQNDNDPRKINLGIGAYREENNSPIILNSVRKAGIILQKKHIDHEYLPIDGHPPFVKASIKLSYGTDFFNLNEKRIACAQTLGGTGALRLALDFLSGFLPYSSPLYYLSSPCLNMHRTLLSDNKINFKEYRYYDNKTKVLDFKGMQTDILNAPKNSIIILQTCSHNPTGKDLTISQWDILKDVIKERGHIPIFDLSYQGLSSGNIETDAYPLRMFAESNIDVILIHSFAKNFFLYGQRIGCLSFVCSKESVSDNVLSQLKYLIRRSYSNPPCYGAYILDIILNDPDLFDLWKIEIKWMVDRLGHMRQFLTQKLKQGAQINWDYLEDQKGLFAYTSLNHDQIQKLAKLHHVYCSIDGRINLLGVNRTNIDYITKSINTVTKPN